MTLQELERLNDLMDKKKYYPTKFKGVDQRELDYLEDKYIQEESLKIER